jgi:pimeloyl-ACP methyl ester carboxylesterase
MSGRCCALLPLWDGLWAPSDPFFLPPGSEAFKRDNPSAEVHFFETGHFALETHTQQIANAIRDFLGRKLDGVNGTKK